MNKIYRGHIIRDRSYTNLCRHRDMLSSVSHFVVVVVNFIRSVHLTNTVKA
jgi:hypothetical protein